MRIIVVNTKGGSSKSTTALQVCGAYFLQKGENVELIELDDENKDASSFTKTSVLTTQMTVGDGMGLNEIIRDNMKFDNKNIIFDIGGNKTTTLFLDALKKTNLYTVVDLIIIPLSGGHQDLINAQKTYDLVKGFGKEVIFVLSRVRNMDRIFIQYQDFFRYFPNSDPKTIKLKDSDVIDLSRLLGKTVYEIANDDAYHEALNETMREALKNKDNESLYNTSVKLEIFEESKEFLEKILVPAWKIIDTVVTHLDAPKQKD